MWRRRYPVHIKHTLMLLLYPVLIASTGYALFSQELSIDAVSNKPAYTATPNSSMSYTVSKTPSGGLIIYNITATVKNIGAGSTSRWQVKFDLPSGFSQFSCANTVTCTTSGTTVTVNSGTSNSSIPAGGSTTFTFTFRTSVQNYQLQNLYVIGIESVFHSIGGLTVSAQRISGSILSFSHTYRFTVTNNTGQPVKMWRISGKPWSSSNDVTSMDSRVHWIDTTSEVLIIDTDPIANGTSMTFDAQFSSGLLYSMNNVTIVGIQ